MLCLNSFGQKIYVKCDDPKPKGSIEKKLTELNYIVSPDSVNADIIAYFTYEKAKKAVSFKVKPNIFANIIFYDNKSMLLSTTQEVGGLTAAWSGYNPRVDAAWKILTRDFEPTLTEAVNKIRPASKNATPSKGSSLSTADELEKLKKLYDNGTLTKDEFEAAKKKLLGD